MRIVATGTLMAVLSVLGATASNDVAPVAASVTAASVSTPSLVDAAELSADHAALEAIETASIVKVDILAALLDAQDGELTAAQQQQSAAMIERSDNGAATELFDDVGGEAGLEAYNATLGLVDTVVDEAWGLTQTTAADQLVVLQAALQYDTVRELMGQVVDDQRFGVSAAADDPADAVLKVGYLQRSVTRLWDVTSIGEVTSAGRTYLVAVLSDGNGTMDSGVALVDAVAEAAVPALVVAT